jgi:hypothetical protein
VSDQERHNAAEVDRAGEEIRGRVCDRVRAPRSFSGWLGLIGALDAMMGSPRQGCATAGAGTPDPVRRVKRGSER